ncbi:F-box only protein 48-like [Saccostrea cucullata]|uniref:F-box only protein 48-like n=1 Tax=Saccostrea cuccullata TaxID=36930 RepID=UPI002ED4D2C4
MTTEKKTANFLDLPHELQALIFSYLPNKDIFSACLVCKQWNSVIMDTEFLWKVRCNTLQELQPRVRDDKAKGHSWKETFKMNYGRNGVKRMWQLGFFSNPASYDDLPQGIFSNMDVDSWADIFQLELERS